MCKYLFSLLLCLSLKSYAQDTTLFQSNTQKLFTKIFVDYKSKLPPNDVSASVFEKDSINRDSLVSIIKTSILEMKLDKKINFSKYATFSISEIIKQKKVKVKLVFDEILNQDGENVCYPYTINPHCSNCLKNNQKKIIFNKFQLFLVKIMDFRQL